MAGLTLKFLSDGAIIDIVKVKKQRRLVTQFGRCSRSEKQHGNMSQ